MSWDFFYSFTFWHIWLNRNHNVFNNHFRDVNIDHLIACILEFKYSTHTIGCENKHCDIMVKWFPPLMGGIKLNVDGSYSNDNQHSGIGGVFRDCKETGLQDSTKKKVKV